MEEVQNLSQPAPMTGMAATSTVFAAPPSGLSITGRQKRRARTACQLCRWKKVRCDTRSGQPCSNCNFEGVQCLVVPHRPPKARSTARDSRPPPELLPTPAPTQTTFSRATTSSAQHETDSGTKSIPLPATAYSPNSTDDSAILEDPRTWSSQPQDQSPPQARESVCVCSHSRSQAESTHQNAAVRPLPDYIKPCSSGMDPEDVQYLHHREVFKLPDLALRDACLRSYFQHVQPIYPILDPAKIASQLRGSSRGDDKLSLLLLYALIFVGSTWVEVKFLRKLGYLSRKAFRRAIHRKMRLLYDADYENNRLCLIQVCVLWTFWFEGPNEIKDGWHWIGVALSLSRVIGLHRALVGVKADSAKARQRRRLWWSLATRDVICSFALSRPPRIAESDYNISMLEVQDFDSQHRPELYSVTVIQSSDQQKVFADICVLYVQLVHIFGRVSKAAYPESGTGSTSVLYSSQQLAGSDNANGAKSTPYIEKLKALEEELDAWRERVPDHLWHCQDLPPHANELDKAALAHRGLLSIMYYATIMILHRPQMLPASTVFHPHAPAQKARSDPSRATVRLAALQITQIAMTFYEDDLVETLAATCVTCLILASISHLFDMVSDDSVLQSEATHRLEKCKAIFRCFKDNQSGAEWALHVIDYITVQLKRQHRANQAEPIPAQRRVNSANTSMFPNRDGALTCAINDSLRQPSRTYVPDTSDLVGQRSTNALISGDYEGNSTEVFSIPAPFMTQPPCENMDESFMFDTQYFDNNLINFTGPDLAWLDISQVSEFMDGFKNSDLSPF